MQRLVTLCSTSRFVQVVGNNYSKSLFKRSLASKISGQTPETTTSKAAGGKVWSAQNPDEIHIAPLGRVQATTFTASTNDQNPAVRETTVYTTQGKLNIADPFTTHTLKADATSQQLAEAEAASAFNTATSPTTPAAETVFAPKISSTEKYSTAADFNSPVSESASHDTVKYETAAKGKVFGGQDTTADTKKHPKENPFNLKEKINPRQAN